MNTKKYYILLFFLLCAIGAHALEVSKDTTGIISTEQSKGPYYMALKTNALYSALAIPNVGIELQ